MCQHKATLGFFFFWSVQATVGLNPHKPMPEPSFET